MPQDPGLTAEQLQRFRQQLLQQYGESRAAMYMPKLPKNSDPISKNMPEVFISGHDTPGSNQEAVAAAHRRLFGIGAGVSEPTESYQIIDTPDMHAWAARPKAPGHGQDIEMKDEKKPTSKLRQVKK